MVESKRQGHVLGRWDTGHDGILCPGRFMWVSHPLIVMRLLPSFNALQLARAGQAHGGQLAASYVRTTHLIYHPDIL